MDPNPTLRLHCGALVLWPGMLFRINRAGAHARAFACACVRARVRASAPSSEQAPGPSPGQYGGGGMAHREASVHGSDLQHLTDVMALFL